MLAAVVVLLGLGVSATGMSQLTEVRLTQAVDRNWRGAYDILVTPRSHQATAGAATTSGLIEPDFLSYGGHGGITFSQLAAIRRIPGVALAAPVSTVGYVVADSEAPDVQVPLSVLPRRPALYRVSLRVTTSDGVHRFTVARQSAQVVLGPEHHGGAAFINSTPGSGGGAHGQPIDFELLSLPPQVTPVVAVDPRAEWEMFGPSFSFLKRLSIKRSRLNVGRFPVKRIARQFGAGDILVHRYIARQGGPGARAAGASLAQPVLPIVVSEHLAYPLRLTLRVDRVGRPLPSVPNYRTQPVYQALATAAQEAGPGLTPLGRTSIDLSRQLRAFEPAPMVLRWPGSPSGQDEQIQNLSSSTRLKTQLAARGTYRRRRGRRAGPAFRIQPLGLVGWNGQPVATQGGAAAGGSNVEGSARSYRRFASVPFAIKSPAHPQPGVAPSVQPQPFLLAPVGSFDLGRLRLPSNPLNHVPLGAWESASAQLLARRAGRPGAVVRPTSNPLGFLTDPPEVITNIDQASLLRGKNPIDAIRVRVGDLSGFDAASRAKVERVASEIVQLGGLNVRIVAGSSPRAVDVYVPRYLPGRRDLGWVQEDWTSLGAAQAASSALSGAEKALLFLSLGLALLLAVTVSSVGLEGGARDVRVWRSLGWGRLRMLWWLVSDAALGGVLIAAAAVAATLAGGRLSLLGLGVGLGGCLLGIQLLFALLLLRRELGGSARRGRLRRVIRRRGNARTGVLSVASRAVVRQARVSVLIAVGIMLSAVVVVLGAAALRSAGHSAHTSLLGAYLNSTLLAFHAISLALLVIGGIAAAAIATRAWQRRRTGEIVAFAALGWQRKRVLAQLRLERVLLGVVAALLALALAAALHTIGVAVGGLLALPIIVVLCCAYIAAGELPTRRFVQSRWPT
jgi:putative ABC transport system permease protein